MNYYEEIKTELMNNEVYKRIKDCSKNRSDLSAYYKVGKLLNDAGKNYGEEIIKKYSDRLLTDVGKIYTKRTLFRIRQFYIMFSNKKVSTLSTLLSWSHYVELLSLNDINEINYYIKITEEQNLSVRNLRDKIKSKEYERLDEKTKNKIINKLEYNAVDFVKNPILIKNSYDYKNISEKILQKLILENISSFLRELGAGFSYIDNEYKIKVGDTYNYIDLLLYNIKFKCYVVIELKVTKLKKEHTGQIQTYMNYIDRNVKEVNDNKTVGIIICKKNNEYVIDYCSDNRVISREYELV